MYESTFYLGVMHGFRIATEPSTQKALGNTPFGYSTALGAMHGWSDDDGYYENYLGHPIEGAVSDYLWLHNDLRYRNVEFGKSRDYWMSRLRAYAYSWSFSEQFEIGLINQASLGQIQRYCCADGFVDHVITPKRRLDLAHRRRCPRSLCHSSPRGSHQECCRPKPAPRGSESSRDLCQRSHAAIPMASRQSARSCQLRRSTLHAGGVATLWQLHAPSRSEIRAYRSHAFVHSDDRSLLVPRRQWCRRLPSE